MGGAKASTLIPTGAGIALLDEFSLWVERHDDPTMLQRKLSAGLPVANFGLKTWFRWQTLDRAIGAPGLGDGLEKAERVRI